LEQFFGLRFRAGKPDCTLADLLEERRRLLEALNALDDSVALAALALSEQGASRRDLAREFGVGVATVQAWIERARRLG